MGTITDAAQRGDTYGMLLALRDKLAEELDRGVPARELASVSKRLIDIQRELEVIDAARGDDPLAAALRDAEV